MAHTINSLLHRIMYHECFGTREEKKTNTRQHQPEARPQSWGMTGIIRMIGDQPGQGIGYVELTIHLIHLYPN